MFTYQVFYTIGSTQHIGNYWKQLKRARDSAKIEATNELTTHVHIIEFNDETGLTTGFREVIK